MASNDATARKAFLAGLQASRARRPSLLHSLWASRWPFIQWVFVLVVFVAFYGQTFGPEHVPNVVAVAIGLLLGLFINLRGALRSWPWLSEVIDWAKVERELSERPEAGG